MDPTFLDRTLGAGIPYITYAIPVFLALIALEVVASLVLERDCYRLNDSLSDLSCGISEQVVGVFLKTVLFGGYVACYEFVIHRRWNIVDVTSYSAVGQWAAALTLFLGVDLAYYWFHRIAHERNLPWAAHVVHHSSEEYNLTVALRQGAFQSLFSWVFYLPLGLLGFPPLWFLAVSAFDTIYQFWIHTRLVGRLGPLEWVFNTPSHHRVHHARNPRYLDRNYAGVLIVWDRWFGTFAPEEEEPVYGITTPLRSWNPIWANLHVWADLAADARQARRWAERIRVWVAPQGWHPSDVAARTPRTGFDPGAPRYDLAAPWAIGLYVSAQFLVTLGLALALLVQAESGVDRGSLAVLGAFVVWSLSNGAGLTERRWWALRSEAARLVVALGAGLGILLQNGGASPGAFVAAGALASGAWLRAIRESLMDPAARQAAAVTAPDG